jgi:hypothetical protein
MVDFLSIDDRGICGQREVDAGIGNQVGLELIQASIKSEISSDGSHNLTIKVSEGGTFHIEVFMTDARYGLIVYHEGTVRVFQFGVSGDNGVVGLSYSCGNLKGLSKWRTPA